MGPRDWRPGIKNLKTKAEDNRGHTYRVYLQMSETKKWVLCIAETPGHWYMSTLLGSEDPLKDRISIDFGAKWDCINFDKILAEALSLI